MNRIASDESIGKENFPNGQFDLVRNAECGTRNAEFVMQSPE